MITRRDFGLIGLAFAAQSGLGHAAQYNRILSIGGSVTEIIYALDQGHRLIARDTTSTYPPQALDLPDVGYARALAAEGVLSVGPELIIAEEGAGPPETIDLLEQSNIPFITAPDTYSRQGVLDKIRVVGDALQVPEKASTLARKVDGEIAAATHGITNGDQKRVLFIISTQGGRITASGIDTAADGMISLAGGINAISSFTGYKQVSDEAITAAAPDTILMMDRGGDHGAPDNVLFNMPAIATTPAGQNRSVIRMNGLLLLGFGPRTGQAVKQLNTALYG
ncbi:heme/hemin ABC transporter substrate-binding protein [Pseudaestuariivita rosea]|uniref:heme/hemin ABC transporter substrate-binding protein n=1 Tax=Pseudaestuariivita rosea TaxID=2763263 RepID=UPI001ABBDA86|nr:ABC transporter substrate-binding protein [Pseudaestuariivita rosea]